MRDRTGENQVYVRGQKAVGEQRRSIECRRFHGLPPEAGQRDFSTVFCQAQLGRCHRRGGWPAVLVLISEGSLAGRSNSKQKESYVRKRPPAVPDAAEPAR